MINKPIWPVAARIFVGLVLVAASIFKISGSIPLWFSAAVPFAPNFWVLAVLVELLLGLILISGIGWGRSVLVISLALFSTMAAIAIVLTLRGESSCGCLGRVPLRPWVAAILDVSAIGLLLIAGRGLRESGSVSAARWTVWRYCAAAAVAGLTLVPATLLHAKYREAIFVDNPIFAQYGDSGSWVEFPIEIQNRGSEPVRLYGLSRPRHIRLVTVLPLVIEPGATCVLDCHLFCGGTPGPFATRFRLWTDVETQRELVVHVNGGVR